MHIVNGAAGDEEGIDPSWVKLSKVPFVAIQGPRNFQTGYSRVSVNQTTLSWEFVISGSKAIPELNISNNKGAGDVYDSFVLSKSELPDNMVVV